MTLLEANGRKCEFLRSHAPPNVTVVWGRAEEQEHELFGVALAKALAPPPVAAEWCLPLVGTGGAAILFVGPSADAAQVARAPRCSPPSSSRARPGSSCSRSAARRLRAFRGAPGWRVSVRSAE